jgi:hypothetical protein
LRPAALRVVLRPVVDLRVVLRAVVLRPFVDLRVVLRPVVLRAAALPPLRAAALRAVFLRAVALPPLRPAAFRAAVVLPVDLRVPVDLLALVERVVDRLRPVVFFTAKAHTSVSYDRREIFPSLCSSPTECAWNKGTFTFIRHDFSALCKHLFEIGELAVIYL